MTESAKKKGPMKNVAVRVDMDLYIRIKKRLADDASGKLQSLIVSLLTDFASEGMEAVKSTQKAHLDTFIRLLNSDDRVAKDKILPFLQSWGSKNPSEAEHGEREEKATGTGGRHKG